MKFATIADVKAHLSTYIKQTSKEPIVVTKNDKPIAILLNIRDEQDLDHIIMNAQEIEEKRLMNQVNESLGLITAEVAHKVGNAAGKIKFIARERLLDISNLTESQSKDIQVIIRNAEEMIRATEELFKPFEAEPKTEITVEEMMRVAIGQCVIPENIELYIENASDLPKANVQVSKVQSYLVELLNNAIKYAEKGLSHKGIDHDSIEVVSKHGEGDFIEIFFTNHGPAIPFDRRESIFRVFSADTEKSQGEQSYGLGLWGARATMQQQGGDVSLLESDNDKTTFVVRLPSVLNLEVFEKKSELKVVSKPKILHLEDDSAWIDIVRSVLDGYDVYSACTLMDAIELYSDKEFDIAITDISLIPDDSQDEQGEYLIKALEGLNILPGKKIIVLSAYLSGSQQRAKKYFKFYRVFDAIAKQEFDSKEFKMTVVNALKTPNIKDES